MRSTSVSVLRAILVATVTAMLVALAGLALSATQPVADELIDPAAEAKAFRKSARPWKRFDSRRSFRFLTPPQKKVDAFRRPLCNDQYSARRLRS